MNPMRAPHLLLQASFGVLMGALFTLLLIGVFLILSGKQIVLASDLLSQSVEYCKICEKLLYIFTLIFGGMGAYFLSDRRTKSPLLLAIILALSIPIFNILAQHILQQSIQLKDLVITFLFFITGILYLYFFTDKKESISFNYQSKIEWSLPKIPYFIVSILITLILLPASFEGVAAHIAASPVWNVHVVSYLIAPSLYFLKSHLLPGIDYFTQYSLGVGWIFSFLAGNNVETTITNYVYLTITLTWLFYLHIFALLCWLYESWKVAAIIALLSLIFLFVIDVHFVAPSAQGVMRYPFLGITAFLVVRLHTNSRTVLNYLLLACVIAFSIFLNTEIGIIILISSAISILLTSQSLLKQIYTVFILYWLVLILLITLFIFVFGPNIFQVRFFEYIFEPLILYGQGGMGGLHIAWTSLQDLNGFYNCIAPTISIATLALIARFSSSYSLIDRSRLLVLAYFSAAGLMMMFKYINMSLIGVWQVNAVCLLIPIGWWVCVFLNELKYQNNNHFFLYRMKFTYNGVASIVFISIAIWMALFTSDSRNPSLYGMQSWVKYPSFIASIVGKHPAGCFNFACVSDKPNDKDIKLIQERIPKGEQVALISPNDWIYLVDAKRAPLIFFLPSTMIFTQRLLNESVVRLEKEKYLFLPNDRDNHPIITGPLADILKTRFYDTYVLDGVGEKLSAWRRKTL